MSRFAKLTFLACLIFALVVSDSSSASGREIYRDSTPSQWPSSEVLRPALQGLPNGLRISGGNRYDTSAAVALTMRGLGQYPFDTPDTSSAGAPTLSEASGWWGLGSCPTTVIVVAGDNQSDAVVAAVLSDPTTKSSEPYLQRYASSDPLFLPIGGFSKVETARAPILLTQSTRIGASSLSAATRFALQDLSAGGCRSARTAVIVGGPASVPVAVESEIIAMGFREVFRVSGGNRYGTAAAVARSLLQMETIPSPRVCGDSSFADHRTQQTFHGNGIVEWRPTANSCQLLARTVVISDGVEAVDALAASWWTSFWQVPVLLHNGSNQLPVETSNYLATSAIDNVFVLGGSSRISSEVVAEIQELTGASVRRVSGSDRYATSVAMAKHFGGWWPTGRGVDFAGALLCVASSSFYNDGSSAWSDALVAGPFCGAASGAAAAPKPPERAFAPVNGIAPGVLLPPTVRTKDAVPIILIAPNRETLPPPVEEFLTEVFAPADRWCSSVWSVSCVEPGFAVLFGGTYSISDASAAKISSALAGRSGSLNLDVPWQIDGAYLTDLPMGFISYETGEGPLRLCLERDGYQHTRWVSVRSPDKATPLAQTDVMLKGWYRRDADGVERAPGLGAPGCLLFDPGELVDIIGTATGISGQRSEVTLSTDIASRLKMDRAIISTSAVFAGGQPLHEPAGGDGLTTLTFVNQAPQSNILVSSVGMPVQSASITVDLYRNSVTSDALTHRFEASWLLTTVNGPITGSASGEARFTSDTWWLVGKNTVIGSGALERAGTGGFSGALVPNGPENSDDLISWRLDAVISD